MGLREDMIHLRESFPDYDMGVSFSVVVSPEQARYLHLDSSGGFVFVEPSMDLRVPAGMVVAPLDNYQVLMEGVLIKANCPEGVRNGQ